MFAPVVGLVVMVSERRIVGRSALRYLTIAFLFVMMMPPIGRGWLTNAVSSCLAGLDMGPHVSFPRYVIDWIVTKSSAVGKL